MINLANVSKTVTSGSEKPTILHALTASENILAPTEIAGLPKARERALLLLDEVGLRERGHHYPSLSPTPHSPLPTPHPSEEAT